MQTFLDANCLLRYLLDDIVVQSQRVTDTVMRGACTAPEYIAECAYVLTGFVYSFERGEAAGALIDLLDDVDCEYSATVKYALEMFAVTKFDFLDCMLAARHAIEGVEVMTFDKKLARYIEKLDQSA